MVAHDRLVKRGVELAAQIAEVPADTMTDLKEIYARGAEPTLTPALHAEQDIAGARPRDFDGLRGRFDAVSLRNRAQIAD